MKEDDDGNDNEGNSNNCNKIASGQIIIQYNYARARKIYRLLLLSCPTFI